MTRGGGGGGGRCERERDGGRGTKVYWNFSAGSLICAKGLRVCYSMRNVEGMRFEMRTAL